MRRHAMDWDNLKFFLALAETGSLSRAARQHRVDHSTVARRIEALERELGVVLVERLARSYRLTAEGERVRERLRGIEADIADIVRLARAADASRERIVRVSGPPALLSGLIAPRLLPLSGKHAGVRVELVGEAREISLGRGEADIALRLEKPRETGVIVRKLAVLSYGLYGTREHLSRRGKNGPEFLGYDESLQHLPQHRWLKQLAGDKAFALRSNDLNNLLLAARAGLGLAVLPCVMARNEPALVRVPTTLPPLRRELWLVFQRDIGRLPPVRAVINRVVEITTAARPALLGEQN